jgi:hypothetical protein
MAKIRGGFPQAEIAWLAWGRNSGPPTCVSPGVRAALEQRLANAFLPQSGNAGLVRSIYTIAKNLRKTSVVWWRWRGLPHAITVIRHVALRHLRLLMWTFPSR